MTEAGWSVPEDRPLRTVARNVGTRYLFVAAEMLVGLLTLPFNLRHLGVEAYGLWMLTAGITVHFSVLDLGYGSAIVKYVAQYRARCDAQALNEIVSTMFVLFSALGLVVYAVVIGLAFNLQDFLHITAAQADTGKWILLIVGLNAAINFGFAPFGGVCSGFQRYDINNFVAIGSSFVIAAVNVVVLSLGYGLVTLVAATTAVRLATYVIYRHNAYRVFPALRVRPTLFRRSRVRELTSFSIYSSMIDWANKLNYEIDEIVVGVALGVAPVAVWAVADRVTSALQRLTNQGHAVLFPLVVDSDVNANAGRLRTVLLEGTRLSLATVAPIAVILMVLAEPVVRGWVGSAMAGAAPVIQLLAIAVVFRVGNATGTTLLSGTGHIRWLAFVNLGAGVGNLALSAALVKPFGLVGVAMGTLIPVVFSSCFLIFPAACRRVALPVEEALRYAILPALWPACVVGVLLQLAARHFGDSVRVALVEAAVAGLVYLALFAVAVGQRDRRHYTARILELAA